MATGSWLYDNLNEAAVIYHKRRISVLSPVTILLEGACLSAGAFPLHVESTVRLSHLETDF